MRNSIHRTNTWKNIDWITVILFLIMVILGWINIYSVEYNESENNLFSFSERYGKQFVWILLSFILASVILVTDAKFYSFFAYLIYGLIILCLLLVLLVGQEIHGSRSWFVIGSVQIQPSEFAKFATILALSRYMSTFNFRIHTPRSLLTIATIILLPAALILLQPDTGSSIIFIALVLVLFREGLSVTALLFMLLAILLFILTLILPKLVLILFLIPIAFIVFWFMVKNPKYVMAGGLIMAGCVGILWVMNVLFHMDISHYFIVIGGILMAGIFYAFFIFRHRIRYASLIFLFLIFSVFYTFSVDYVFHRVLSPYQQKRINVLLNIQSDPFGDGYNVNQSKIAIGSGGFAGKGFLNGTQTKFKFVPEQSTDFIFCTVGEEWGFIGTTTILALFTFLLLRILMLAEKQRSSFSRIYGYGVFSIFFAHMIINIGMTIGLSPVIGIPLPFFSYGGSSLWAFTILLFIFIRLDGSRTELVG